MEPIAYLTVEVKHRELESRILIASKLLQAGYAVVLGQQWSVFNNADTLPPGVILFKTVNDIQARNMANFRKHGHLVAATDEEVLICVEDICFMLAFGPIAAQNCDLFLAQSVDHQTAIERKFPALAGKTRVVGNPRVDLLAPAGRLSFANEAHELKKAHGPYILFNTNYGSLNSIWKSLEQVTQIAAQAGAFNPNDPNSVREFHAMIEWERRNRDEMLPMMHWTAQNLTTHNIVIRPHPAELAEFWINEFGKYPQVRIIPRSNPHPWIMAAEAIVHTGCTTGLEAKLLDKTAVNIMPSQHPVFDRMVNHINPTFAKWQDAAAALQRYVSQKDGPLVESSAAHSQVLEGYLPGYKSGNAATEIANGLIGLLQSHGARPQKSYHLRTRNNRYNFMQRHATQKDKFSAMADEIAAGFDSLGSLAGPTGNVSLSVIDDSLFLLTRN
jgi:surface carbohydrate biosynthesis protein